MIKAYKKDYKKQVEALLRKNTPEYFHPEELQDFSTYLDEEVEDYFVYLHNAQILAAGGINYFYKKRKARISWDMVAPESHGMGFGTQLVAFRLELLRKDPKVAIIEVRTTQKVYPFYQKNGFVLKEVLPDYWAKGFDLYRMELLKETV